MSPFSLVACKIFSLSLAFSIFSMMYLFVDLFNFILLRIIKLPGCVGCFPINLRSFQPSFLLTFFLHSLLSSPLLVLPSYICWYIHGVPYFSESCFTFPYYFFLCSLPCVLSIDIITKLFFLLTVSLKCRAPLVNFYCSYCILLYLSTPKYPFGSSFSF